jgi:TPR repeat protein
LLGDDWKQGVYVHLANHFKQKGQHLSPQLEQVFSWYEGIENDEPDAHYQIALRLLESRAYPEAKILACEWFYKAETKGHSKARFQLGRQLALGDGVKVAPEKALLLLELSANVDKNVDAYLLAAQLLQQGDVYEKHLPNAYFALLKAQALGADLSDQLKQLEPLLTKKERENAKWWADFETSQLSLSRKSLQFSQPSCSYSSR